MPYLWETWEPGPSTIASDVRSFIRAVMGLHSTFSEEIWLWRGQADASFAFEPAMHTRIRRTPALALDEMNVRWATRQLIELARDRRLDRIEDLQLPDLALLAHLQHHGAATPLLDVTVDPFVAMWMVVHAGPAEAGALDDRTGLLFGIRRPPEERCIDSLDSRPYWDEVEADLSSSLPRSLHWYRPPDVSERLRIQRGSFLVGPLSGTGNVTVPVTFDQGDGWLATRVSQLGKQGKPVLAKTELVAFKVRPAMKPELRTWLAERAGLTQEVVYPTPWHRPYLEEFCRAYGRSRPIDSPADSV
jgi:hypothetical protein